MQRRTESSGREEEIKKSVANIVGSQELYETGSRNASTVSEGIRLVKPRGLSGEVVIGFPSSKVRERTMAHTMREVARRAGVSLATVSRVLNNTQYISETCPCTKFE